MDLLLRITSKSEWLAAGKEKVILMTIYSVLLNRLHGVEPDQDAVKRHQAMFESKLEGYECLLSKSKYMAGDVRLSLFVWRRG